MARELAWESLRRMVVTAGRPGAADGWHLDGQAGGDAGEPACLNVGRGLHKVGHPVGEAVGCETRNVLVVPAISRIAAAMEEVVVAAEVLVQALEALKGLARVRVEDACRESQPNQSHIPGDNDREIEYSR